MEQVGDSNLQNNKSSYSLAQEGNNDNDEYYVTIQNRLGWSIFKPNRFGKSAAIPLGILTCKYNACLQASRPGSIETTENELTNVSIFKETMDNMDLISWDYNDGYINFADPRILAAKTSQKDDLHFRKAMKSDDRKDFMKATEIERDFLTTEDVW